MSDFVEEPKRVVKKIKREAKRVIKQTSSEAGRVGEKYWKEATRPEVMAATIGYSIGGPTGAAIGYGAVASSKALRTMTEVGVPRPSVSRGPAPTTVMAAERAEVDRGLKRKRQAASVMGGDYGILNVQTNKLGT